ncbi:ATP-binding cassette domain-containing protein [bacterium]|nr:ATP-binding cassette domain-containing protein [bacterium]
MAKPSSKLVTPVLETKALRRVFKQGGRELVVLDKVDLTITPGTSLALVGPSGCGKTTLLQLLGLLDRPDGGSIHIMGKDASNLNDQERTRLRRDSLGFVYQYHHLLPECSALENVAMPLMIAGTSPKVAKEEAARLLTSVGLKDRVDHRPGELSGGQQQRVAIARALAGKPGLILADEPTGNLDPHTASDVMELLLERVKKEGASLLIVTHNLELAKRLDRAVTIREGVLTPL